MKIGAVIVAAGMSSRMRQYKQLMKIGDMTMAERVIINFQRAGIKDVVMVTGFQADQLEKEIQRFGVTFLRNRNYETTQMFDSAKLGLSYIHSQCDRILFCPVDVPLFSEKTVKLLAGQEGKLVFPVYGEAIGHPILLDCSLIPDILRYKGERGLKGALDALDARPVYLQVADQGVILDADTKEDYDYLVNLHNASLMRPQIRVRLIKQTPFFGPGTVTLLKLIENLGSVREACEKMGISYSKGWTIIHTAEEELGYKVVERRPGGRNGGRSTVSPEGLKMIQKFEEFDRIMQKTAEEEYRQIFLNTDC